VGLRELKVMSFNIWRSGGRSLERTIAAIRASRADVIGLQECNPQTALTIAGLLGCRMVHDEHGHAILTRFRIAGGVLRTKNEWGGMGATIELDQGERVHVFDAHLHWTSYGPYHLRQGRSVSEVMAEERTIRMPGLDELLATMAPAIVSGEPTFLVGDFNAPSHLDYVDVPWPTSLACYERGLFDSYRVLHSDLRTYPGAFAWDDPGITWTPIPSEEPHAVFDRIDFVYYLASSPTTPTRSIVLDERAGIDPWPSDHRAVLSTFQIG
jgi:endonuclease/exonuclease/phosphatase family metal-dependent hydrolase